MAAETIAKALGGRKTGGGWAARCPAHDDRTPSLSIPGHGGEQGAGSLPRGCDQERVIAALRGHGLWAENGPRSLSRVARRTHVEHKAGSRRRQGAARSRSPFGDPPNRHRERQSRPISHRAASTCRHPTRFASMPA